jgi:hypothetical protein
MTSTKNKKKNLLFLLLLDLVLSLFFFLSLDLLLLLRTSFFSILPLFSISLRFSSRKFSLSASFLRRSNPVCSLPDKCSKILYSVSFTAYNAPQISHTLKYNTFTFMDFAFRF